MKTPFIQKTISFVQQLFCQPKDLPNNNSRRRPMSSCLASNMDRMLSNFWKLTINIHNYEQVLRCTSKVLSSVLQLAGKHAPSETSSA